MNSGSLDQIEFEKAMKECDIIDLSKKAISHLFRYFGSVFFYLLEFFFDLLYLCLFRYG